MNYIDKLRIALDELFILNYAIKYLKLKITGNVGDSSNDSSDDDDDEIQLALKIFFRKMFDIFTNNINIFSEDFIMKKQTEYIEYINNLTRNMYLEYINRLELDHKKAINKVNEEIQLLENNEDEEDER